MPLYESTFIARHDMSAQQVERLTETFSNIVKERGGEVTKSEYWGLRNLAYRIKKNRKGHYVFFNIDAPSPAVQELERNFRLNEDVLRFLTVSVDELDPNPSPMMQARAAREDRSRRGPPGARGGGRWGDKGRPEGGGARAERAPEDAAAAKPKPDDAAEAKPAPEKAAEAKPETAAKPEKAAKAEPAPEKEAKAEPAPDDAAEAAPGKQAAPKRPRKAKPKPAAKEKPEPAKKAKPANKSKKSTSAPAATKKAKAEPEPAAKTKDEAGDEA